MLRRLLPLVFVVPAFAGCVGLPLTEEEANPTQGWRVRWDSHEASVAAYSTKGDNLSLGGGAPDWSVVASRGVVLASPTEFRVTVEGTAGPYRLVTDDVAAVFASEGVRPGTPAVHAFTLGAGRQHVAFWAEPAEETDPTKLLPVQIRLSWETLPGAAA